MDEKVLRQWRFLYRLGRVTLEDIPDNYRIEVESTK